MNDNTYGVQDENVEGGWNGMVGELVRRVSIISNFMIQYYN